MKIFRLLAFLFTFGSVSSSLGPTASQAGIIYDTPDSTYSQNFDSLASIGLSAPWTNNSTLLGWSTFGGTNGTVPTTFYNSGNGTEAGTGTWSYGSAADDRALGSINASTTQPRHIAVAFDNNTSVSLSSFSVAYDGEQWRKGVSSRSQSLSFAYGFGTAFSDVSSWTSVSALNFVSLVANLNQASPLDGNSPSNRRANITGTITSIDWQAGTTLWLRWTDAPETSTNAAHGLAIDNFSFSASSSSTAVPEPSSCVLLGIAGVTFIAQRFRRGKNCG